MCRLALKPKDVDHKQRELVVMSSILGLPKGAALSTLEDQTPVMQEEHEITKQYGTFRRPLINQSVTS